MAVEIIFMIKITKVWDRAEIELATPGSRVRHVTDCATQVGTRTVVTQHL